MSFDMVYANQRDIFGIADRFRFCHTNKQCTDKSRTICDTDGIHIIQCHACIVQCLSDHRINLFNMFSRSDLRYDTAKEFMQFNLG